MSTVPACYAYLVVERQRYPLGVPSEAKPPDSHEATPASGGDFPDRLRSTLDAAAKNAGYGSLERLMNSARTIARPTPSRAQHVRRLLDAGLVSEDNEISRMAESGVPDAAWEVLKAIDPDLGREQQLREPPPPPQRTSAARCIESWSLALHTSEGVVSFDVDPTQAPGDVLPLVLIAETLERLALERWTVVQVSEDRAIDDAASRSHVVRQRFLLCRWRAARSVDEQTGALAKPRW